MSLKTKLVTVLDEGTRCLFLVGMCESSQCERDEQLIEEQGWDSSRVRLLVHMSGSFPTVAMSSFNYPQYDLNEYGNMDINHTTIKFAEYVKKLKSIEDLPDEVDVKEK